MHAVVMDNLEEYLEGALTPAALRDVETHLNICQVCREEVHGMQGVSQLFGSLRLEEPEPWDIAPGFYAQVMQQVGQRTPAPSFFNLFGLDAAFGRRLVFASLLMLATLGGYLVSHESAYAKGPSPEAILAQQNAPAFESARAEDNMMVVLTASAYEH